MAATLKNWAVGTWGGEYQAPEQWRWYLNGEVFGHPTKPELEGHRVITSQIDRVEGDEIITKSGTRYKLEGPPLPEYLEVLKNTPADPEHKFASVIRKAAGLS